MKTFFLSLFAILGFSAHAQDDLVDPGKVAVYFKVGGNSSNHIQWDDNEPTDPLIGPAGGMGIWIQLSKSHKFMRSLSLEGNFSGQGFQLEVNDVKNKVRTAYFGASLSYRQYLGKFFLTAGGEHAWLMSAINVQGDQREDFPEGTYQKTTWNGIGGIGVNFGAPRSRQLDFGMELTYRQGLNSVRSDFVKARQQVVTLSLFIPVSIVADMASGLQ